MFSENIHLHSMLFRTPSQHLAGHLSQIFKLLHFLWEVDQLDPEFVPIPFPTTFSPKISFWCTKVPWFPQQQVLHHLKKNTVHVMNCRRYQNPSKTYNISISIHALTIFTYIIYIYNPSTRNASNVPCGLKRPFFPRLKANDIVDDIRTPLLGPHSHGSNLDADARFFHQEDQQFHHMTCMITIRI